ncbi:MAG: ABC transporter permease [Bacteroidota bacterium]
MKYYFQLQFRRIQRKIEAFGIQPTLGIVLAIVMFILFSKFLFYKTRFAPWIYLAVAVSILVNLGEQKRSDLLKNIFLAKPFRQVRMLENALIVLPFCLYLIYEGSYWLALGLPIVASLLANFTFRQVFHFTIPTPFWKFPFEFIVGFRKLSLLVLIGFLLTFQAIRVENHNLGFFSLGLQFFIALMYYNQPENPYFVWIFKGTSQQFLRKKIVAGLICSSITNFLIFSILIFFFSEHWMILIGIQIFGYVLLIAIILAKYSAFPSEMSLPQVLLYLISLIFPPLFLFTIPMFYKQSKQKLKPFLK